MPLLLFLLDAKELSSLSLLLLLSPLKRLKKTLTSIDPSRGRQGSARRPQSSQRALDYRPGRSHAREQRRPQCVPRKRLGRADKHHPGARASQRDVEPPGIGQEADALQGGGGRKFEAFEIDEKARRRT